LPAGAKVRRLPTAAKVTSNFGSAEIEVSNENNKVVIKSKLALSKSRITPGEYAAFRDFCQKVDDALSQRLVVGP
jgi:hypothetical protein